MPHTDLSRIARAEDFAHSEAVTRAEDVVRPRGVAGSGDAPQSSGLTRGDVFRTLLWIVVVISAIANMAASYGGANTWVHLACGVVTVLCGGTLVVRSLRGRR